MKRNLLPLMFFAAFALLAVAVAVFALGECLHGAVQPALVVDLADHSLLGRYMAMSALSVCSNRMPMPSRSS